MDSVAEKFSVFDFFNLIITGTVFLFILIIGNYPCSKEWIISCSNLIGESKILLFVSGVTFISVTAILGAAFLAHGKKM